MIQAIISFLKSPEKRNRFIKFGIVGFSGVFVNMGLLWFLKEQTRIPFYLCSFIAIECSIITNFLFNDNWTWRDQRQTSRGIRFWKYHASTAFTAIFLNITVLLFLKEWLHLPYLFANFCGICCGMLGNFILNHFWTYGSFRLDIPKNVLIISGISLVIRLFLGSTLGAGFDEAYYFSYALRPALSYFDHPPIVGLIAGFFPFLTGITSPFTIRLGAILLFSVSSLLFFSFARKLVSEREAFFTFLFFHVTPMFPFGAGIMILPDAGLTFFWIITLFIFKKIIIDENPALSYWIFAGLFTGLAMLSKYHGVFLGFSLILYMIFIRPKWFLTIKPYLYGLTAIVTFCPVLIWNMQHDFISFTFQGNRAFGSKIDVNVFLQAIIGQAAYLGIVIFIVLLFLSVKIIKFCFMKKQPLYQFIFFWGVLPVLFFNMIALFQKILPHWPLPGYILMMLPLGIWYRHHSEKREWLPVFARSCFGLLLVILSIGWMHTRYGILHFENWMERGWMTKKEVRMDGTLDVAGWPKIREYLKNHQIDSNNNFLFTYRWFLSGQVELATNGKYPVLCFHEKDPRGFGIWDQELDMRGKNGISICTNRYYRDPRKYYADYFLKIHDPDSIPVYRGKMLSKTIYFFRCDSLLKNYPSPYHK